MRIVQINWITAHNYGEPKWHLCSPSLSWKGKNWASTLPHKMCPRKKTTEPKLLILVSFFSGEVTSYTDTSYCIHILREECRSVFSGPPCIRYSLIYRLSNGYDRKCIIHMTNFLNFAYRASKSTTKPWHIVVLSTNLPNYPQLVFI